MNNIFVWMPRIKVLDATRRSLWENLRDIRAVSKDTSLVTLLGDASDIPKSALFEMCLRRCMKRLKDASDMHPCQPGKYFRKTANTCERCNWIVSPQRRHGKDIFFDIFSRRLKDVPQKTSFLRCFWDSWRRHKKNIFWEIYLRRLQVVT